MIYLWLVVLATSLLACQPESQNAGASSLLGEDAIRVKSDTFAVSSLLKKPNAISLTPDSFLLGECDTHFGTIKADILTQMACPVGYQYPQYDTPDWQEPVVDSVCLYMYYQNWYGDGMAPLGIAIHELDLATLNYTTKYPSDTLLSTFCSLHDSTRISPRSRVFVAKAYTDSVYSSTNKAYIPCIRIKLTDEFAKRFFSIKDFSSQERFNEQFKGLYISTEFGGSTLLYINDISMAVFYHFSYPRTNQADTTIHDVKAFYANSEVRQVNRYIYPDRENILNQLNNQSDTNYIVSPANIYTEISLDIDSVRGRIKQQLGEEENYRVYVNRANVTVEVLYNHVLTSTRPRDQWDTPASNMMLIREDKLESFFAKNELPTDTVAMLASLTAVADSLGNISYSYSYDLSGMLTQQLRKEDTPEQLKLLLVPVSVETESGSTNIKAVKQLQTVSTTYIRSANSISQPTDLEMVYSGFNQKQ